MTTVVVRDCRYVRLSDLLAAGPTEDDPQMSWLDGMNGVTWGDAEHTLVVKDDFADYATNAGAGSGFVRFVRETVPEGVYIDMES